MKPTLSQFQGCLVGQCLGDALGFPVEGHGPETCAKYVQENIQHTPDKMLGRAHFPFGQYTDDSQLARELIQSYITSNGQFHPEEYATRIAAIFADNRIVGRGLATHQAAENLIHGVSWKESGIPAPNAGNGSAMRAAPIGMFFFDNIDLLTRHAVDQGRITHTDPRCHAGAMAIAGAVALAFREEEIIPSTFLPTLVDYVKPIDSTFSRGLEKMEIWLDWDIKAAVKVIGPYGRKTGYEESYTWRNISPYVISSVLWSLYAFLKTPESYTEAIITSIIVGGDVDTTAAMTGAISGAYLGIDMIPKEMAHQLTDQGTWGFEDLMELAKKCYAIKMGN